MAATISSVFHQVLGKPKKLVFFVKLVHIVFNLANFKYNFGLNLKGSNNIESLSSGSW
jgi:hypothetical protein